MRLKRAVTTLSGVEGENKGLDKGCLVGVIA